MSTISVRQADILGNIAVSPSNMSAIYVFFRRNSVKDKNTVS